MKEWLQSNLNLHWMDFGPSTAQTLSFLCIGLFLVMFGLVAFGILKTVSRKSMNFIGVTAFYTCVILSFFTSIIYIWHHYFRVA